MSAMNMGQKHQVDFMSNEYPRMKENGSGVSVITLQAHQRLTVEGIWQSVYRFC